MEKAELRSKQVQQTHDLCDFSTYNLLCKSSSLLNVSQLLVVIVDVAAAFKIVPDDPHGSSWVLQVEEAAAMEAALYRHLEGTPERGADFATAVRMVRTPAVRPCVWQLPPIERHSLARSWCRALAQPPLFRVQMQSMHSERA